MADEGAEEPSPAAATVSEAGLEALLYPAIRRALDSCLLKTKEEYAAFEQAWVAALTPKAPPKKAESAVEKAWRQLGLS